ncbi:MAG TPA: hypothetical protein VJI46_02145 [Candidatus Nanoarchaeia archaeon]|nr:hypothetical protein [Candidatus Nanoarchaeia archaeon]
MRTKCEECGGKIAKKNVDYSIFGTSLGKFPAEVCSKCGETCFEEETSRKMTQIAKERGLWKLETKTKIGKVGDALDVRFNKRLAEFLNLKKGEEVTIYPESKNRVVIEI